LHKYEDISFVNTEYFIEVAKYFDKHGVYTHAPKGSNDYIEFWDEQERRCKEGYKVGDITITGEHYGYLNFGRIRLIKNPTRLTVEQVAKGEKIADEKVPGFPKFYDGDYHYFKTIEKAKKLGKHVCIGKARRKGYSFKNAWIAANRANLYRDTTTVLGAYDSSYLYPGLTGTMTMVRNNLDFINKHTDWNKGRLKNGNDHIKIGYKKNGIDAEFGFLSEVICATFGLNNPGAARGKDGTLIMLEEAGKFPNLLESLASTKPTVEDGGFVTGQILIFGTGGGEDSNWDGFEEIFYNPDLYNMMPFENVWDDDSYGSSCGFFIPQEMCLTGFVDDNGNSLLDDARKFENQVKEHIKENAKSDSTLVTYMMEYPSCPKEAFSRTSNNIFPTLLIEEQLKRVQNDPNIKFLGRNGVLFESGDKGLKLKLSNKDIDYKPILNFPLKKGDNVEGCFVEWQPPYRDSSGKVPKGLYRVWNDPYAQDKDKDKITANDSLGATYVYERTNTFTPSRGDIIVGAYIGRPSTMDEYNEQLLRITRYYNAECMFENDRGDVKNYFKKRKEYHLLADEPEITWKKELQSVKTGRNKGIMMNEKRKGTGAIYLRDWLITKRGVNQDEQEILNLHYIYDEALLKELLKWNKKGNFDRVSCLLVGMFDYREAEHIEVQETIQDNTNDFFNRQFFT